MCRGDGKSSPILVCGLAHDLSFVSSLGLTDLS